jgi:oligopeptide/dipeptide ABC transporter ATP-binding protein
MRQRVVIALALACRPSLVIADEPTTALDVTVQAQILDLMARLRAEMNMSMMLITHDLGVIAENCDEVVVMYAGRVVEKGPVSEIFAKPLHAYTRGLLRSMPTLDSKPKSPLPVIPGMVASLGEHVHGCRFCQRMGIAASELRERPALIEITPGHWVENCERCYQP